MTANGVPTTLEALDMLLYEAWCVIANASDWHQSDWNHNAEGWKEAAVCWRETYHAYLDTLLKENDS